MRSGLPGPLEVLDDRTAAGHLAAAVAVAPRGGGPGLTAPARRPAGYRPRVMR